MTARALSADLERLVMQALERPYSSFSSTDDSETGNRYQAVGLGGRTTRGQREGRSRFLDVMDLRGRRVLDLGSNLGEISREARRRGAALVDGFEIDPYFNEIAHLVNVLTGTTGVSFYERDMADPATYGEPYDVVLAFSAFRFIAGCLDRLAAVTDVLVVETHELKGNFDDRYLGPLTEHFPAFVMLGESDVERLRPGGVRAVGLFARDEGSLLGALAPELRKGGKAAAVYAAGARGRRVRGEVGRLEFDGARARLEGWCRDHGAAHDAVELSTPARGAESAAPLGSLAVVEPTPDGGFAFDCEAPVAAAGAVRFDVSAYAGDSSLGSMSAYWAPGLDRDLLPALTVAHELLEPVGRYRALESFASVLDRSAAPGATGQVLARLLPNAEIATADSGAPFDLVVAHDVDVSEELLGELHRVTAPGSYLALGVLGELARRSGEAGAAREDLLRACSERFDVVCHIEGGVAGLHDLVVLRPG